MIGERLKEAVQMSRPMDGDTFMAGCICHCGGGRYHIEFVRYRNSGGIVGCLSRSEVAAVAPDLVAALRAYGAELRAFLAAEDGIRLPPGGVGSSGTLDREDRTRDGAGGCDCNGEAGFGYAHVGSVRSPQMAYASAGSGVSEGVQAVPAGGFARGSCLTARHGKRGSA